MRIRTSGPRFVDDSANYRFFAQALAAVRQVPGVRSAALTSALPLSGDADLYGVGFESDPEGRREGEVFRYAVSSDYFATMGIRLVAGRFLDANDRLGTAPVVVLSEDFARRKLPGVNPVGRRVRIGPDDMPWRTIVGIVGDVKQVSLALQDPDAIYMPADQSWSADRDLSLVVRTDGDPIRLTPAIKNAIWNVDPTQAIVRVAAMDDLIAASAAQRRFALIVLEAFGLVALLLATTGIYGVLSGNVTERLREIGVRSALGASSRDIIAMVGRQAMTLTAIGIGIGLLAALAASRLLIALLYDVSRHDPITYAGVVVVVVAASAAAALLPAMRATGVDPTIALRAE
jgi:putative ABC transport system permease protein